MGKMCLRTSIRSGLLTCLKEMDKKKNTSGARLLSEAKQLLQEQIQVGLNCMDDLNYLLKQDMDLYEMLSRLEYYPNNMNSSLEYVLISCFASLNNTA